MAAAQSREPLREHPLHESELDAAVRSRAAFEKLCALGVVCWHFLFVWCSMHQPHAQALARHCVALKPKPGLVSRALRRPEVVKKAILRGQICE